MSLIRLVIADDHVILRHKGSARGGFHAQHAAGEAFAHVVVAVAGQGERDALGQECAKALARAALEMDGDGVARHALLAVAQGKLAAQNGASGAVGIVDGQARLYRVPARERAARGPQILRL